MDPISFAQLVAPLQPAEFFENYWEKKLLFNQHDHPQYFDNVLSVADIDAFFCQHNLIPDGVKLMDKGTEIPQQKWTRTDTLISGMRKTVVNPDKIFSLFQKGATIIINAAELSIPKLAAACRSFEQEMKVNVQSNIYITPPDSQGFAVHYDPHDIFSMQVKGPKTWRIYKADKELATKYRPFTDTPELIDEFDIQSGDMLYIPRGTIHEAFSSATSTIHVNFSCKPRYGFHLIEELAKTAEENDIFFRKVILPDKLNADHAKAYADAFRQKLLALIDDAGIEKLLEKQYEYFTTHQLFDFGGRMHEGIMLDQVTINTAVSRRKGFTALVLRDIKNIKIKFGTRELHIPRFIDDKIFFQDEPFQIKDIKGLITDEGKLAMAKEFIASGFLQIEKI